ncbi:ficolin-1-like isoform X1 [Anneissia japonica]|uniref:ficolin-1-like isoform X1 n=1 Tax=Anneissia japonica TaxID=1529436 RepID=UPI0014256379|nr:ficolin-1-like isoform X1 [Anneissia japonica]
MVISMKAVILLSFTLLYTMYSRASDNLCSPRAMTMVNVNSLLSSHSIQQSFVRTLAQCVHRCLSNILRCTTVAYYKETGSCEMYGVFLDHQVEKILFPSNVKLYGAVISRDCTEVKQMLSKQSGVYDIKPCPTCSIYKVYCDMNSEDNGWTVLQRRRDNSVDFYRIWEEYADGFGDVCNEFWIGNNFIHTLTSSAVYELRIDLIDYEDNHYNATYDSFRIESKSDMYRLRVGNYTASQSNIDDSLKSQNNACFSTRDMDNDNKGGGYNCATVYSGAWWFVECFESHLNGRFSPTVPNQSGNEGIVWRNGENFLQSRFSEMKIQRIG